MGRLLIHVGTHKTGTTSIQRSLAAQRSKLAKRGIDYPGYDLIGHHSHYAHFGVVNGLMGLHQSITVADAERFFALVAESASRNEATVISAESLYRHIEPDASTAGIETGRQRYWRSRVAFIERFRKVVGPAEIVLVLRRQCDLAESLYQEQIKVTRYGRSFSAFLRELWYHFEYLQQIEAWRASFGTVRVLRLADIAGPNIARRFLLNLDLKPGPMKEAAVFNEGLPTDAVILKRWLNRTTLSREELAKLVPLLSNPPVLAEGGRKVRRSFFGSAQHRADFQAKFDADNAAIAKLMGAEGNLFSPVSDEDVTFGDDIDLDVRGRLVGGLLATIMREMDVAVD